MALLNSLPRLLWHISIFGYANAVVPQGYTKGLGLNMPAFCDRFKTHFCKRLALHSTSSLQGGYLSSSAKEECLQDSTSPSLSASSASEFTDSLPFVPQPFASANCHCNCNQAEAGSQPMPKCQYPGLKHYNCKPDWSAAGVWRHASFHCQCLADSVPHLEVKGKV